MPILKQTELDALCQWVRRNMPVAVKERAGVVSPWPAWMIFQSCYMYGPHPTLWRCIKDFILEWRHDRHIVG